MSDDRLFDGPPAPDPEVERLERLLAPHGAQAAPPARRRPARRRTWLAVAALLALAAAAATLLAPAWRDTDWTASALSGSPSAGGRSLGTARALRAGEWLETGPGERALLELGLLGRVELEPGSRLSVVRSRAREHRLRLERGAIAARTRMPPRWFFVETPAGEAVDLGCAFVLRTDAGGAGRLAVTEGFVAFEGAGRESLVPAGGGVDIDPERGPGTPLREGASAALRRALARLDAEGVSPERLDAVLAAAEPADGLSLWHLLARTQGPARARVHDRLAELCPPPPRVARGAVLRLDHGALARWQWPLRRAWAK